MIYHIVTGDMAAAPLAQAIEMEPSMAGTVIVIKDVLSVGPIQKEEGQKFSELRSAFWQDVVLSEKNPIEADDLERLILVGNELYKDPTAQIWIWNAPSPADVCTYHWAMKYVGKWKGRLYVVNIAGLPFLDENGKLIFPKNISEILPKELVKARKLARLVTPAEVEIDTEEWDKLVKENAGIRTLEGSKRLTSRAETYYDNQLMAYVTPQFQKASKVINNLLAKVSVPTGDLYLGWRLRKMGEAGLVHMQGEVNKGLKDFEVKQNDGTLLL
ncbi:hypothetical protein CJD36_016115 [Flavipsychrobacter stenotrophus]|uniref:DUF1835 domain-containing protein n=1 Tax=Flavipsychrobacter stenotrophus TaxID=2077091 RepID=A0A2S7SUE2_9BACT|nr:DUF3658 domain-containing protein [Flavipsychrobacter stenotrophus]PQJ10215.1 hypothetical protein CJD36_016115 [Flavipsychrobacter stenotrophus]